MSPCGAQAAPGVSVEGSVFFWLAFCVFANVRLGPRDA